MRARRAIAIAVSASLVIGGAALLSRSATDSEAPATEKERMAAAVQAFIDARNRMTPEDVRRSFGEPDEVFRDNPRALCWAYADPYEIRMCWGPKRQSAWISHNIPPGERVMG